MKALNKSFVMFLRQIAGDSMLYAVLAAPLLAGCFFRFGIPFFEQLLCGYFVKSSILTDYYRLFDLFLTIITPYMFCFASSMVMLSEYDENISSYMAVTPLGKWGYIASRLIYPAVFSIVFSVLITRFFSLTEWKAPLLFGICLLSSLSSVVESLLIVSLSHNRVEGMAVAKLSGLLMLGLPVPFFLFSGTQYLFSPLPSFWIAKLSKELSPLYAALALITSVLWLWALYGRFVKKLS